MDWRDIVGRQLDARDAREKSGAELFDDYARLAARTASLERERQRDGGSSEVDKLRSELAELHRKHADSTKRLETVSVELEQAKERAKRETAELARLRADLRLLDRKSKNREEEMAEKNRSLETIQDELLALQLQLNVSEDRSKALEDDNKQLVERWMQRMAQEAAQMNRANEALEAKRSTKIYPKEDG